MCFVCKHKIDGTPLNHNTLIYHSLYKRFKIRDEGVLYTNNAKNIFSFLYGQEKENSECFEISIRNKKESLKFPNEFYCKLSGTEILYKLYQAAKDGNLERIALYDMSHIITKNIGIPLKFYSILLHGTIQMILNWYLL
jgi:hypothetical protein